MTGAADWSISAAERSAGTDGTSPRSDVSMPQNMCSDGFVVVNAEILKILVANAKLGRAHADLNTLIKCGVGELVIARHNARLIN